MAYVHSKALGPRLCEALGIPHKGVYKLTIETEVGQAVRVTTHQYVHTDGADDLTTVLTEYLLVERTDDAPSTLP